MLEITIENPDQPEIRTLLAMSNAYMASLYPAESNHMVDADALAGPEVTFVVARTDQVALGISALVKSEGGWSEIKRMFVAPSARGQKIGRLLLQTLEAIAAESGVSLLRLETGAKQPEALGLYRSAGFVEIDPFGTYRADPLSIFMEKTIGADTNGRFRDVK